MSVPLPGLQTLTIAAAEDEARMPGVWNQWEGRVLQQFPLSRYLGSSDHSAVFLTEYESKPAVMKLLAVEPAEAEAQLARWRVASKLSHPHLLQIYDVGSCRLDDVELIYVIMEHADDNLGQILPQRALTAEEAVEVLKPVLDALSFLHNEKYVHGRIRPSNILAVGEQLKISSDSLSPSGGVPKYKASIYDAPETQNGKVTTAADVWSLGVTLVESLTQRLPSPARNGEPVLPDNLPEPFSEIVRDCLIADPKARRTLGQISEHLDPKAATPQKPEAKAQEEPIVASAEARTQVKSTSRLNVRVAIPVIVALAVGGVIYSRSHSTTSHQVAPVAQQQQTSSTSPSQPSQSQATPDPVAVGSTVRAKESAQETEDDTSASDTAVPPPPSASEKGVASSKFPGIIHSVMPAVSASARHTIRGKIRVDVRVQVAPSGTVEDANLRTRSSSKYFSRVALDAARQWTFSPTATGSTWLLRFAFTRRGTDVSPIRSRS